MRTYLTIQGDTWDAISYRAYGSEFYTAELFNANPDLQKYLIFSANIPVNIPDIEVAINPNLPPWERPTISERTVNNELVNLVNNYDDSLSNLLSYRLVSRFNVVVTDSSRLEG